VQWVPGLSQG